MIYLFVCVFLHTIWHDLPQRLPDPSSGWTVADLWHWLVWPSWQWGGEAQYQVGAPAMSCRVGILWMAQDDNTALGPGKNEDSGEL